MAPPLAACAENTAQGAPRVSLPLFCAAKPLVFWLAVCFPEADTTRLQILKQLQYDVLFRVVTSVQKRSGGAGLRP